MFELVVHSLVRTVHIAEAIHICHPSCLTPYVVVFVHTDVMINFRLGTGVNKHICELQVIHTSMFNVYKGLPGHLYPGPVLRNHTQYDGDDGILI